jgi:hypothetical protein
MLPHQKLIVLSIIWTVCIGIIFTVYLFKNKKKVNYLILLVLISSLPLISLIRPGSYESGDFSLHIYRAMDFYQSLEEGIFPVNWAGSLNASFGYPLFNFIYPLPYYTVAFFHFLEFSFVDSLKIFIALTFVISGVSMYYFLKSFLPEFYAFAGGIFYLFAPYHLVNMHFRVDIGEIAAIAFVPLLFLFSSTLLKKDNPYTLVLLALTICVVILSHQAVSLIILPLVGIYSILLFFIHHHKFIDLLPLAFSAILGGALASFYLLPVLFELPFTQHSLSLLITFEPLWKFFYTPWRYGLLFQGPNGELSFLIGYIQWLLILLSIILLLRKQIKKSLKPFLIFSLCSFSVLFLFMQEFSTSLWYTIPLIKNIQFSYRLMAPVIFFTASIAAITCVYLPKKLVYLLIGITIFSTILNWGNRRNVPELTDTILRQNLLYSTHQGEGLVPAAPLLADHKNPWFSHPPKHPLEVIKGRGNMVQIQRKTTQHIYTVNAKTSLILQENTVYFPGWKVIVNGQMKPFTITTKPKGILTFSLPKGIHTVKVMYEPTWIRKLGILITIAGAMVSLCLVLFGYKKYSKLSRAK